MLLQQIVNMYEIICSMERRPVDCVFVSSVFCGVRNEMSANDEILQVVWE